MDKKGKKVIVRQKTGGNEWIALAASIFFLAGSIIMIISRFNKKVDATIPILIAFIGCTLIATLITIRLFLTRNALVLKKEKLILKGIFYNKKIDLKKVESFKFFEKRNELTIKFDKKSLIIVPKTIDKEYLESTGKYEER